MLASLSPVICAVSGNAGKRLRGMYRHLGTSNREEANLTLRMLTAIAARGPAQAGALLRGLDWQHKVLAKLAKPERWGEIGDQLEQGGWQRLVSSRC